LNEVVGERVVVVDYEHLHRGSWIEERTGA
jgi:hypothetical protein